MDAMKHLKTLAELLDDGIEIEPGPKVSIANERVLAGHIEALVHKAVFGSQVETGLARWLIRSIALELGIIPASIHDLYVARGRGATRADFTVPAMNLRTLPFNAARAVFHAAMKADAKALIFEIARSEIGYTGQRPSEYAAAVLGAAIAEGYKGPVFIQGDHFQVSLARYKEDAEKEVGAVKDLSAEALAAGFFNIDIDTSTLVDLSKETIPEQQHLNYSLCADIGAHVRSLEPKGVTVSLGGEIGEVGGHNSTEAELRAFMEGFNQSFTTLCPNDAGLSKISIQTGTSHGGVVLPDGSIAQVKVDFDTLAHLSKVAREYGMGGAVQHGASTLPEEAFPKFVEAGALEVHLATNFQNIMYDRIPDDLRREIYAYLRENHGDERKEGQTDEQFFYKTRKRALGRFKRQIWDLPADVIGEIEAAWQEQFENLFSRLNIAGTSAEVADHIRAARIVPDLKDYVSGEVLAEDISDLAD